MDKKVQVMNIIYSVKYEGVNLEGATNDIISLLSVTNVLVDKKTKISNWAGLKQCGERLRNNIINIQNYGESGELEAVLYVEDINKKNFRKTAGLGIKSWLEFIDIKSFYG